MPETGPEDDVAPGRVVPPFEPTPAPPLFDAILRPHRSLTPVGLWVIVGIFAAASFAMGTLFLIKGAWPVFGFYGLDVALVYWALKASSRQAGMFERVELTRERLTVRRVSRTGKEARWEFQPYWLKVELEGPTSGRNRLTLRSHGRRLEIGVFLAPEEKITLALALRGALAKARTPVF
ncbi:MAG: DUF2244 domain-containing protein [Acetobacteraceae bacterium]|nr:DUF2244 domain-containing protein [Acetobacteraceae bacterium]